MRRRPIVLVLVAAFALAGAAAAATTTDPLQPQEWWLAKIGADRATPPGPGVPLTIVDSGVDLSHPEFAGRPDTTALNPQTVDGQDESHGTEVASVAAAPANGVGLVGVYPQARLQSYDVTPSGAGSISDVTAATGIERAADAGCPGVINVSFGGNDRATLVQAAVLSAVRSGCLVVAAAGNGRRNGNEATYPASYPHVLTVASTNEQDQVSSFSTGGPGIDVAAPGENLTAAVPLSRDPSGYATVSGTSFSAPLVAAAAAWIWTVRPTLDAGQVAQLLRSTARDVGPPGFDDDTGYGVIDIPAALAAPAPPKDPGEPNDDVPQVKPRALFEAGQPALTAPGRAAARVTASIDSAEDPRDVYRIWVPARRRVHVTVSAQGNAAARIWGPSTVSVNEGIAARRRDLLGTTAPSRKRGYQAYVEVFLTGRSSSARYTLAVTAARR